MYPIASIQHQNYPFESLIHQLDLGSLEGSNPLFDVAFALQNIDRAVAVDNELSLVPYNYASRISKFDLTLWANEGPEEVLFSFEYCTKLFKPETIHLFTRYFKAIITSTGLTS